MVVAIVIVINYVIGGFSWVDLVWLAASTVWWQVSDHSQLSNYTVLSDYNCAEWLVEYKAADAPITFEEIVMAMINTLTPTLLLLILRSSFYTFL